MLETTTSATGNHIIHSDIKYVAGLVCVAAMVQLYIFVRKSRREARENVSQCTKLSKSLLTNIGLHIIT